LFLLQGSALHEHLSKLGYTDFETVSVPKRTHFKREHCLNIVINFYIIYIYAYKTYIQEIDKFLTHCI